MCHRKLTGSETHPGKKHVGVVTAALTHALVHVAHVAHVHVVDVVEQGCVLGGIEVTKVRGCGWVGCWTGCHVVQKL